MQGEVLPFRDFIYCIDTEEYNFSEYEEWQIEVEEKKLSLLDLAIAYREYCDVRSRGASKTWIEMAKAQYLASLRVDTWYGMGRLRGYWYSTSEDQLDQPREYFDHIIDNSFLKYCVHKRKAFQAVYHNYGQLKLTILTAKKARSGRADFIILDEEAGLQLQNEKVLYDAAVGVLSGTWFGLKGHISTPSKGSKFEENHEVCRDLEYKTGYQHTFKIPWWDVSFLAKNKEFYEQEERTKPRWWYLQEYCAEFTHPLGAVFQNVEYGTYPDWLMESIKDQNVLSGLDWNPVAGHIIVGIKWTKDLKHCAIMEEADIGQGYAVEMTNNMWNIIKSKASHGRHMNYECSGINEEYVRWLNKMKSTFNWVGQNWHSEEWDSAGINKLKIATFIIQNAVCIWVDKVRFPNTAKDIEDCQWDPESDKPRLKKNKAASPHYLDAFLHAASEENRRDTTITFGDWY